MTKVLEGRLNWRVIEQERILEMDFSGLDVYSFAVAIFEIELFFKDYESKCKIMINFSGCRVDNFVMGSIISIGKVVVPHVEKSGHNTEKWLVIPFANI